ncbi:MAG: O-antigen ligase family protein [Helicobacteraceae bacterium]|nr:O-antigen ligase family protein [Helicobacteraceae bacterium]
MPSKFQWLSSSTDQRIYYLTLLLAFSLPLSRASLSFFALVIPFVWLFDQNIKQKLLQIKDSSILIAISFFLCLQTLSILYTQDQDTGWNILRLYSYWIVLFVIATSIKQEQVPSIITAFLYGMLLSEICAYIIYFDIYPINGKSSDYPNPFMHHILYSVFLALSAALLLNRLLSNRYTSKEKAFIALFFITITINLFISTGRTGQLAFFVAIFISTLLHFRISLKTLIISLLLSTTIFYSAYKTLPQVETRLQAAKTDIIKILDGDFNSSWGVRAAFWIISYEIVKEHPLIGVGVGDYKTSAKEVLAQNNYNFAPEVVAFCSKSHFHNQYLMVLIQTGLLGLLSMFYLFYKLFKLNIKNQELKEINIIFLSVMLTAFIAEPLWIRQFTLMLFLVFSGLMIASQNNKTV